MADVGTQGGTLMPDLTFGSQRAVVLAVAVARRVGKQTVELGQHGMVHVASI